VLVAGLFDILDGALARFTNRTTKFGAILDSTLDRLSEALLLFGLLILYLNSAYTIEILLIFGVMVGSFLISYIRARAEGLGIECKTGLFTRAERVIILALGLIVNQILIALIILAVFTFITVVQRIVHVWQQTRKQGN
jgi:CDP-diacylglycerol--glycerol-3-phosphate 3-phosphatidyltransferase